MRVNMVQYIIEFFRTAPPFQKSTNSLIKGLYVKRKDKAVFINKPKLFFCFRIIIKDCITTCNIIKQANP